MMYVLLAMPPVAALIALIIALRKDFHKQVLFFSISITMAVCMLTMEYLTFYGFLCMLTIPVAVIYIFTYLMRSLFERRKC